MIARAWLVIVLGGAATYLVRASFLLAAHRLETVPPWANDLLRMIPAAALAALAAPALLRPEGDYAPLGPHALAGLVALVVARLTRSLLWTILVGMGAVVVLDRLLG